MNEIARDLARREPLVPLVPIEDFEGPMRTMAERAIARSGRVPNQARAMANASELGATYRLFFEDLFAKASLPPEFRFLIRYKVSTLNACLYCSAHQIKYMGQLGVDEDKIANIHDSDTHPAFDERERVALAFAKAMTEDAANIPADVVRRFVATFTPAERVEIAMVAGAMGYMNKVNDALRVPLEDAALDVVGTGIDPARLGLAAE
jgi:alkylhydroperoxidase family enzyme